MDNEMMAKIQQLKDMLNNEQVRDNIKNMMGSMSNNNENNDKSSDRHSSSTKDTSSDSFESQLSSLSENAALISKMKKLLDMKRQNNDPRSNLLSAIKPYLNENRQKKIDKFSNLLSMSVLAELLKDED